MRPAAPPTCFPFLCDATRRDRHLFAALFVLVSIYSVPTVGCNIFLCYSLAFVSTYSLVVSICVVFLFAFSVLQGPCPCVILRNRIFGAEPSDLSFPFSVVRNRTFDSV